MRNKVKLNKILNYRHSFVLVTLLLSVFLAPHSYPGSNFNLQLAVIVLIGVISWIFIFTLDKDKIAVLKNIPLISLLLVSLSLIIFSNNSLNNFGSYIYPIGSITILSFIGLSVFVSSVPRLSLIKYIFLSSLILALVCLVYSIFHSHNPLYPERLSGIVFQPDILAAYIAAGFICSLGLIDSRQYDKQRLWLILSSAILFSTVYLTKSRTILAAVILLSVIFIGLKNIRIGLSILLTLLLLSILLIGYSHNLHKLNNIISYRSDIQLSASQRFFKNPFVIAGNYGLEKDLSCSNLVKYEALITTCNKGYSFSSSHNIFIDRTIEFGIIGGLAYVCLLFIAIYRYMTSKISANKSIGIMLLLISIYYLTNVTSIELELLIWLCLIDSTSYTD